MGEDARHLFDEALVERVEDLLALGRVGLHHRLVDQGEGLGVLPDLARLLVLGAGDLLETERGVEAGRIGEGLHLVVALVVAVELRRPFQHLDLGIDADRLHHCLGDDGGVEAGHAGALVGEDRDLLALVAGLLQQLPGLGRVVGEALLLDLAIIFRGHVDRRVVGLAEAVRDIGDELGKVDRGGDGLAQGLVLHQRVARLDDQAVPDRVRRDGERDIGGVLEVGHVRFRHQRHVERAREQAGLHRRRVGDDHEARFLHQRALRADIAVAPVALGRDVAVEGEELDRLAALPFAEHEGAGADRLVPASVGLDRILVEHGRAAAIGPGERVEEEPVRLVDLHDEAVGVGRRGRYDLEAVAPVEIRKAAPVGLRVHVAVPAPQHVGRGHGGPVVELDALAQMESVGLAVRRDLQLFGEQRADRAVLGIADEAFDHVHHDGVGVAVAVHARIGRADVGIEHGGQRLRVERAGREAEREGGDEQTVHRFSPVVVAVVIDILFGIAVRRPCGRRAASPARQRRSPRPSARPSARHAACSARGRSARRCRSA